MRWIPESAERVPRRVIRFVYEVPVGRPPRDPERTIPEALHASSLTARGGAAAGWSVRLPHRTLVYGLIAREVDETVELRLSGNTGSWRLVLSCHPVESHSAHAVGVAGVLVLAAAVWVAAGLGAGALPAVTTAAAGVLIVEVTRQWALTTLERRLHRLVGDLGSALWPSAPAHIIDRSGSRRS